MADVSALERALINADAAGDTAAAQTLASEITRLRSTAAPEQPHTPATPGVKRVYIGPEPGLAETGADALKSAGIGLVEGAIGLAGLPGDARKMASSATSFIGNALGADPSTIDGIKSAASAVAPGIFSGPTSADIQSGIEGVTGKFYEPQTTVGEFARTAGQFAPGIIGGPGGAGAKLLSRVAAPALASEGAGQLTKGTGLEPFARFGGAVLGGAGAAKLANPAALTAPTATEIKGASRMAYKHPEVKALEIDPKSMAKAADDITAHLNSEGFRPIGAPGTYNILQELKSPVGATARIEDITSVKSALSKIASTPGAEGAAAKTAISRIDKYLANLAQPDLLAGDAARATKILKQAGGDWRSGSSLQTVNEALEKAQRQASRSHSGTNIDNATRQKFSSILDNPKRAKFFTTEEKAQMQKIVDGTFTGNLARKVAKLFPTTGLGGMASGTIGVSTGGLGFALPAAGFGAMKVADKATANAVRDLQRMIAMNSTPGRALPPQLPSTNPAAAGLLSGLIESRSPR